MARSGQVIASSEAGSESTAKSVEISKRGIKTSGDFCELMTALMEDVLTDKVSPRVAQATIAAGGRLLQAVEMQLQWGIAGVNGQRVLRLADAPQPNSPQIH